MILGDTMYYDRHLEQEVLDLILPRGPLHWLVDFVKSDERSRLDFRRALGDRRRGTIQLYFGRTSPLEVRVVSPGEVELTADQQYRDPELFGRHAVANLTAIRTNLWDHLAAVHLKTRDAFTKGEAVSHNGLMRRYGLYFRPEDPLLAIDSEVRVGFKKHGPSDAATGTEHRDAYQASARGAIDLASAEIPMKLDTLGVLPTGDLALVEVKDKDGDIRRALEQAAFHVHSFTELCAQADLVKVVRLMIGQKIEAGLLPPEAAGRLSDKPRLIPVVAAPDDDHENFAAKWLADSATKRFVATTPQLRDLRLWHLSKTGEIIGRHP